MLKGYTTIDKQPTTCEIVINKSRFIGYAQNVENAAEANEIIKEISKKYYDASHNCYAYVTATYSKYSDDGEPQGTAGLPILDCIRKNALCDCLVVVTRYFGGIKLGAGGLVRAYTSCANSVLASAKKIELKTAYKVTFCASYDLYQTVMNKISPTIKLVNTDFGDSIRVSLLVLKENLPSLMQTMQSASKGRITLEIGDEVLDTML